MRKNSAFAPDGKDDSQKSTDPEKTVQSGAPNGAQAPVPAQAGQSAGGEVPAGGDSQPQKKSRSKRRRERRNEAKRARAREAAEKASGQLRMFDDSGHPESPSGQVPSGALSPSPVSGAAGNGSIPSSEGSAGAGPDGRQQQGWHGQRRGSKNHQGDRQGRQSRPGYQDHGGGRRASDHEGPGPAESFGRGEGFGRRSGGIRQAGGHGRGAQDRHGRAGYEGGRRGQSPLNALPAEKPAVRRLEGLAPSDESLALLDKLNLVLDEAAPLQAKHRASLKGDIRDLWEYLTSERSERPADYLGTAPALSAYLHYFLPWNIFRLSAIFCNSDFCLPDNAIVADIGTGPLTLPIALWISRPELRDVPLTFYCIDRVERVMEAGKTIFETLCMRAGGALPPWKFILIKDGYSGHLPERVHLLSASNVFNEFFWKGKDTLGERALDTARGLLSNLKENGSLFVMEPGDPRSGAFIAALRAALLAEGASPLGPCPHALSCPMPGIFRHLFPPEETRASSADPNSAPSRFLLPQVVMPKNRDKYPWCHFGVDTDSAPAWLRAISEEAGLPKERAVFSYLWAARGAGMARMPMDIPDPLGQPERGQRGKSAANKGLLVRVISEPFALPGGAGGQYACSNLGYTLLKRAHGAEAFEPGDLLEVTSQALPHADEKSGAIVIPT